MTNPTPRQLSLIAEIEDVVGIQFTGETKQEASVYIDEHLDDFYLMKEVQDNG